MASPIGRFCLVLHAHIPYVLHHGHWPHGESWLNEAAAETYLPLLDLLDTIAHHNAAAAITVGLTPILLEQLATEHFKTGFVEYLHERIERAGQDRREFEARSKPQLAALAIRWAGFYEKQLAHFEKIQRDIVRAFTAHAAAGRIQILTSAATHAYLPLLREDRCITAQLRAGTASSQEHLGFDSHGFWLPECAYRPGIENFLHARSLTHFFVDSHLVANAEPVAVMKPDGVHATGDFLVHWDAQRGWRDPLDPVGVVNQPGMANVFAFARHPKVSEQVWSGTIGYPGAWEYLEFHRKHGDHGLRYHRVTSHHASLAEKEVYDPAPVAGRVYEQAQHFCGVIRETLKEFTGKTGRIGTVVAPFDAELFGHWWFEGPRFLHDVLLNLAHDPVIEVLTAEQALKQCPADKIVRLPEGSWGEGGMHQVWLNPQTQWLWDVQRHAESRFLGMLDHLSPTVYKSVMQTLQLAGRELLLMQSSDWPFIIHGNAAVDYGISRFASHATRFDRLCNIAQRQMAGVELSPIEQTQMAEAAVHDICFPQIDLKWWK